MLHFFGELIAFWSFNLGLKSPLMTKDLSVCRREKECVFVVCVWVGFFLGGGGISWVQSSTFQCVCGSAGERAAL